MELSVTTSSVGPSHSSLAQASAVANRGQVGDWTGGSPPEGDTPATAQPLNGLQALRASAALLVVASHAILTLGEKAGAQIDLHFAWFLGDLGVALFFIISGFVIIHSHGKDFGRPGAPSSFLARRLGRIIPLYWLTTSIYTLKLTMSGKAPAFSSLLLSLLFIPHQRPDSIYGRPVYELGWTLQYEMAFYTAVALALSLSLRKGIALIAIVFLTLVGLRQCNYLGLANPIAYLGAPIVLYFLIGVAIALARRKLASTPGIWIRPSFAGALLICVFLLALAILVRLQLGDGLWPSLLAIFASVLATASCGLAAEKPKPNFGKTLSKGLGDSTYSIYLTHSFMLGPAGRVAARFVDLLPAGVFVALMLPSAAAFGLLTYRRIESPLVKSCSQRLARFAGTSMFVRQSAPPRHIPKSENSGPTSLRHRALGGSD